MKHLQLVGYGLAGAVAITLFGLGLIWAIRAPIGY